MCVKLKERAICKNDGLLQKWLQFANTLDYFSLQISSFMVSEMHELLTLGIAYSYLNLVQADDRIIP